MTWHLAGLGHRPWHEIRDLCHDMTCAWADYDGFHLAAPGGCPPTPPPYSHLWAWSPQQLIRVRIDGDHGIVGILTTNPTPQLGSKSFDQVEVVERAAINDHAPVTTTRLLQVIGPMPLVFVAVEAEATAPT